MTVRPPLVLILENDPASAAALEMLVGDLGYDTLTGSSLAALPELTEKASGAAAIIADYHLQDGTGVDAIARLSQAGVQAPVLLMTGTLKGKAREAAVLAGHRFVEKPAEPRTIIDWLQDVAPF